ncbi:hypothetical protein TNCV_151821 [Trichonephila clavipes]|uniref:Uncharacterized protein n=1 Tax=Trichonephila clavipes TaxID=2585209 RepID=A0A8X6UUQ1_TRICX|nr:hypothetical protein TNCV_151821 [Trichonephila clavipes]
MKRCNKRAHQAGLSRRSLAGVGLSESERCHGRGLALLTNRGVQEQQQQVTAKSAPTDEELSEAFKEIRCAGDVS